MTKKVPNQDISDALLQAVITSLTEGRKSKWTMKTGATVSGAEYAHTCDAMADTFAKARKRLRDNTTAEASTVGVIMVNLAEDVFESLPASMEKKTAISLTDANHAAAARLARKYIIKSKSVESALQRVLETLNSDLFRQIEIQRLPGG